MDALSFALGVGAGVLASVLCFGGFLFWRVRRVVRSLAPLRASLSPSGPLIEAAKVTTDAEGFILTTEDP